MDNLTFEFSGRPVRFELQGVAVDAVEMSQVLDLLGDAISANRQTAVFAINPEKVVYASNNEKLRRVLKKAELLIPDGIGAVLAMRLQGLKANRVPGSELMPQLCSMAEQRGWRVFLLGAKFEVNQAAVAALQRKHPRLQIAGSCDGYFEQAQTDEVIAEINASRADVLFVALGSPAQEFWIDAHREQLNVSVLQGVGGTFDVLAGRVLRAPQVWQTLNLEWLYRLLREPSRLDRQRRSLPVFLWRVLRDRVIAATAKKQ